MTVAEYQKTLRGLTVRDDELVRRALSSTKANRTASHLDDKTYAFVRLSAMISVAASIQSMRPTVEAAQEAGATPEQIVGTLLAVMPATGVPRIVAAAPAVGLALGYDVFDAIEHLDPASGPAHKETR